MNNGTRFISISFCNVQQYTRLYTRNGIHYYSPSKYNIHFWCSQNTLYLYSLVVFVVVP